MNVPRNRVHPLARLHAIGLTLLAAGCAASLPAPEPAAVADAQAGAGVDAGTNAAAAATQAGTPVETDFKAIGRTDAPITIIEFTDLQCPYCANFALQTLPALRERYVEKGLVRFVSRDMPLSMHAHAVTAAVAARCAGEQGRYWEYREALFRGQARLANAPYDKLAERFGLDVERFAACRNDRRHVALVRADSNIAAAHGITSTPTFVIGRLVNGEFVGEILSGAQSLEVFEQRLQALLQDAG
jgi:protein-disulfide isomerase